MINWNNVVQKQPQDKQLCFITLGEPDGMAIAGMITGPIIYDARNHHFIDLFATADGGIVYPANKMYNDRALQWCAAEEINMPGDQ